MQISKEFTKYCLVGVFNTLVGLSAAYFCLNFLKQSYLFSTAVAYVIGIVVSFVLNKTFTFKDENKDYFKLFFKFVLTMLPSYVVSYFLGWAIARFVFSISHLEVFLVRISDLLNMTAVKFTDNVAVLISMVIYVILGFSVNKFLIFNKKNKPE